MVENIPSKALIKRLLLICYAIRLSVTETHHKFTIIFEKNAPSKAVCRYWFQRFENGNLNLDFHKGKTYILIHLHKYNIIIFINFYFTYTDSLH